MPRQLRLTEYLDGTTRAPMTCMILEPDFTAHFARTVPNKKDMVVETIFHQDGLLVNLSLYRVVEEGKAQKPFEKIVRLADKSLLTSMVQKGIRRQQHSVTAKSALELAHLDPLALARRLIIVAVEDVRPTNNLIGVVWLMIAWSNGVAPLASDIVWLVRLAEAISRDTVTDARFCSGPVPRVLTAWKRAENASDHLSLALIIRAMYGGMHGDIDMLLRAASVDHAQTVTLELPFNEVPRLSRENALLEAVDFHCAPHMLAEISKKHQISPNLVRDAIWTMSSATNRRIRGVDHPTEILEAWAIIHKDVTRFQEKRIESAFKRRRSLHRQIPLRCVMVN